MVSLERGVRPAPPKDFEPDEAKVWRQVVDAMPADWFPPETHVMLEAFCRQAVSLAFLNKTIAQLQKGPKPNMAEWRKLVSVRQSESKIFSMLATKMRITHQSTYNQFNSGTAKKARADAAFKPTPAAAPEEPVSPWS